MDALPINAIPEIHEVICMFCMWTWLTGVPIETAARCPRCRSESGVDAFVAMVPGEKGCTLIRPHQMAKFG